MSAAAEGGRPGAGAPGWLRPAGAGDPVAPARAAATVVLLRDGAGGPEVLMLRRTSSVAFGGLWVFPGGAVDPQDADPARPGDELAAARRAAVREAAEEAGLPVAADGLVATALWEPPPEAPRRYRTWFFVAPAPAGDVVVDGGEIDHHAWLAPADALARQQVGEIELAPPTWMTLWRLAADSGSAAGSAQALVDLASRRPAEQFRTHIAREGERMAALWEGDAAYDGSPLDAPGPRRRLWTGPGAWRLEWPAAGGAG